SCCCYYFFCSVSQTGCRDDVQTALAQHLAAEFGIVAFQAHDYRHGHPYFGHGADDAFRDHVAAHDAAENVDQHGFHVGVGEDDLECLGHALLGGAAANVKEVGGAAAVQLHDVHGAH